MTSNITSGPENNKSCNDIGASGDTVDDCLAINTRLPNDNGNTILTTDFVALDDGSHASEQCGPSTFGTDSIPGHMDVSSNQVDAAFKTPELSCIDVTTACIPKACDLTTSTSNLSPAEKVRQQQTPLPYKEPSWSGIPEIKYQLEVLKNGKIVSNIDLNTKPFHVFGRLVTCDIQMDHPSLSRYHAVLQYCATKCDNMDIGWYLYDLNSTHGTVVNKYKAKPSVYHRLRVGHVLKFGGSTRLHILQGPSEDEEQESAKTVSELVEERVQHVKKRAEIEQIQQGSDADAVDKGEESGCMWGMSLDAENPDAAHIMSEETQYEHVYIDDPKKTLKSFFEREGCDLPEYKFTDTGLGKRTCAVELPIDSPTGEPIVAEVTVSGKKKDAVLACALEACRMLDRYGELGKSRQESRKKKIKNWEDNDFYESDDDEFLDRTGTIEEKRKLRMQKAGKLEESVLNYDSLSKSLDANQKEISRIEKEVEDAKKSSVKLESDGIDALEAYMAAIKDGATDTKTRMKLKSQLMALKREEQRLLRLVNITKPANLPQVRKTTPDIFTKASSLLQQVRIMQKKRSQKVVVPSLAVVNRHSSDEEEEEDTDEDEAYSTTVQPAGPVKEAASPCKTSVVESKSHLDIALLRPISSCDLELCELKVELHKDNIVSSNTAVVHQESDINDSRILLTSSDSSMQTNNANTDVESIYEVVIEKTSDIASEDSLSCCTPETGVKGSEEKMNVPRAKGNVNKEKVPQAKSNQEKAKVLQAQSIKEKAKVLHAGSSDAKAPQAKRRAMGGTYDTMKKLKQKVGGQQKTSVDMSNFDQDDPGKACWLPPKDQCGDGRTHLNDKFGY